MNLSFSAINLCAVMFMYPRTRDRLPLDLASTTTSELDLMWMQHEKSDYLLILSFIK